MKKIFKILVVVLVTVFITSNYSFIALGEDLITPSGISMNNLEKTIDEFMNKYIGKTAPGASVAIVKNGKVVFSKGYGVSDLENKIPVTKDTVFEYGSISKLFVWTSAMKLVEEGKLDLDKDIREYLPGEFSKELNLKYPVTMRNIMNHSSGFGEYPFDLILDNEASSDLTLEKAILNSHPKQYFKPGEGSAYSNYATALGALVVEKISGMKFYEYEKKVIFDNLSMGKTAGNINWEDNKDILKDKSKGYMKSKEGFTNKGWSYIPLYPSGSVNGTSEDLAKFAIDIMNRDSSKMLKKETIDLMLNSSYKENETGTSHGYFQYDSKNGKTYGHGGNTKAFSAQLSFNTDEKFALVVLTNAAGEMDITMGLHNLLMGSSMEDISKLQVNNAFKTKVSEFNGTYVTMRRCVGTPLEFFNYLQLGKIKNIDDTNLKFTFSGLEGEYKRVSENEFKLVKTNHPIFNIAYNNLKFRQMENGKYIAGFGKGQDFTKLAGIRSLNILILNLITLCISILYFVVTNIKNIINIFKKKETTKLSRVTSKIQFVGLIMSIAFIIMSGIVLSNPLINYSIVKVFKLVFIILYLLTGLIVFVGIKSWKGEVNKNIKFNFIISLIIVISLINILILWNIY